MMNKSIVVYLALIFLGACYKWPVTNADDPAPSSIGQRLMSIIDLVLAKHIDPPVRQQMILAGAKALNPSQIGQANAISKLVTDDEMIQYLLSLLPIETAAPSPSSMSR